MVDPATSPLALSRALISACFPPQRSCQPSPMTRPSLTMTAPTMGLGLTKPSPRLAKVRARFMYRSSWVNPILPSIGWLIP